MISFWHHSRLPAYRAPQGAAPCGATVHIEADIVGEAEVFLRLYREQTGETLLPMRRWGDRVQADVLLPEEPCLVWYFFVLHTKEGQTFYYGGESGEGMFVTHEPSAYQITVYDGAFTTPRRFCRGLAYQIFPDRFKRSSWEDFRARAGCHVQKGRFLRLHDRWSEPVCSAPAPGQDRYMPDDFFGGDFNGIREKLPYLAELGVTILYLNPIFESPSNHRYDTGDYLAADPILGTEEEFSALCAEAGRLGIAVVLDGVFSHTGADSRYFNKFGRYDGPGAAQSQDSPYYPWYTFTEYPEKYDCWWGFPALPNVNEMNPAYSEFIAGENGVLAAWQRRGASGWRLDVADELPDPFIRLLRRRIKAINPEAFLLGEVWDDCSNKRGPEGRRGYVSGDELDGAMNYPFANAVLDFFLCRLDAFGLNHRLQTLRERYPRPFYEACFNLLGSHDVVRPLTALSGAPDRNALNRAQQGTYTPAREDLVKGRKRLLMATALQMALPGIPCVYYGDEAGMTGMADPFNRGAYPWGNEDKALTPTFRRLLKARRDSEALQCGLCRMGALNPEVFCVVRYTQGGGRLAVLAVNRSEKSQETPLWPESLAEGPDALIPTPPGGDVTDVFSGARISIQPGMSLSLPPLGMCFYIG